MNHTRWLIDALDSVSLGESDSASEHQVDDLLDQPYDDGHDKVDVLPTLEPELEPESESEPSTVPIREPTPAPQADPEPVAVVPEPMPREKLQDKGKGKAKAPPDMSVGYDDSRVEGTPVRSSRRLKDKLGKAMLPPPSPAPAPVLSPARASERPPSVHVTPSKIPPPRLPALPNLNSGDWEETELPPPPPLSVPAPPVASTPERKFRPRKKALAS